MMQVLISLACLLGQAQDPPPQETAEALQARQALQVIEEATEAQDMVRPMAQVRDAFPAARTVLHEAVQQGSAKVQCFAIQVLGESGESASDLLVVAERLQDTHSKVRLAAIMAVRRLGTDGHDALVAALERETLPNNRKMAVKTLQVWALEKSVPTLVGLLRSEKEKGVRNFTVTALEAITRHKLGDDVSAWESHLESKALSKQAKQLAAPRSPLPDLPSPPLPTEGKKS